MANTNVNPETINSLRGRNLPVKIGDIYHGYKISHINSNGMCFAITKDLDPQSLFRKEYYIFKVGMNDSLGGALDMTTNAARVGGIIDKVGK